MIGSLIGAETVHGDNKFTTENPATGEVIDEVSEAAEAQVDQAVAAARAAFETWSRMPAKQRAALVRRLGEVIAANVPEIADLETRDTGLPITQTRDKQLPRAADNFTFFAEMATRLDGHSYPVDDQMLNYTLRRPVGVAGLITPWNTPFMLETWKLAPAIAFGNTVVLKPAELSPLTADLLGKLVLEAGLPPGVVNVVQGRGETVGDALVRHPGVDIISFTGETTTGRRILERGGPTLKRFSMELGGKSPLIVFEDADFDRALDAAVFGIFSLNGERCTANSRILVADALYDRFAEAMAARAARITVGDPTDPATTIGALISAEHLAKVRGYVDLGQSEGATLLAGGDRPDGLPEACASGHFLTATVLGDVRNDMRVAQEEIFGPVACLIRFSDEDEAVRLANDTRYGLAAYVWSGDVGRAHRVAAAIDAGMVFVNSQNVRDLRTPFGGSKESGIGREGGEYSLEVFTELKNVCVSYGRHAIPRWGRVMGALVLAAKVSHVPSIWLSEQPGPHQGIRDGAIKALREIGRRVAERQADTVVVLDTHWMVTIGFHLNAKARHEGRFTSHELPHFIADVPYAYDGDPALASAIADAARARGLKCRSHDMPGLGLEYATLVPMRHVDPEARTRLLPVASNINASIAESAAFGAAIRDAIEAGEGRVALLASGSLSHEMWPNDKAEAGINEGNGAFNRQVDEMVLDLWREGRIATFLDMLPAYAERCHGEAGMADTAALFGALGWDAYDGRGDIVGDYFGSSGTGQCVVEFPVG